MPGTVPVSFKEAKEGMEIVITPGGEQFTKRYRGVIEKVSPTAILVKWKKPDQGGPPVDYRLFHNQTITIIIIIAVYLQIDNSRIVSHCDIAAMWQSAIIAL